MFKSDKKGLPEDENSFDILPPVEEPVESSPKPVKESVKKKDNVRIVREEGPLGVRTYEYRDETD